jgi:Spy/CpxP family protein refolding chaperone
VFRNIAAALFVVCLGVPAFSQQPSTSSGAPTPHHGFGMMPMWGIASDQEIDRSLNTLQRTLDLSPSQVSSIRELVRSRRESFRAIRDQARPKFEQLMSMLQQPNPDPAAVGKMVIDLNAIHQQAQTKRMDMEKQLSSILNSTQQQTVTNLRNQAPTFMALRRLGLLGAPNFQHGTFMSGQTPSRTRSADEEY